MATGKVTISSIAKLDGWLWDTHVTGFGARKQTNGIFYYVRYRYLERKRTIAPNRSQPPIMSRACYI